MRHHRAFTAAGLLLVALLAGATGKPSPPPGPPLPGPPAVIEPGAPPSTLPALSDLPTLREPTGRSIAPSATAAAGTPGEPAPSVKATSSPSPATTETSRRSTGWIGLGGVVVIAGAVAFLVLRRRRHT
ncbi:hypothetical protein ACQEVZ_28275 [Dactylosporangium sp. CA-152071]|uniref:hypothetical protein n=1 Tax=Dactylosporangium sp. CA-152071 TaxID=3239933 RepID=UPI003D8B8022